MGNMNELGLVELNLYEIEKTQGGLMVLSVEFIKWAYTEFKKGVHDGYYDK